MKIRIVAALLFAVVACIACSGEYRGVSSAALLECQTRPTYGALHSLAMEYATRVNDAAAHDTLHPGLYADYGVALALMGRKDAACRMLNAEMKVFPQSRGVVQRLKQRLLPDMIDDTLSPFFDTIAIAQLESWAYDSLAALRPVVGWAPVVDSSDKAWIVLQTPADSVSTPLRLSANQKREMLFAEQNAARMAAQARQDSIAAAKQAKIDARKQKQIEKQQAKKEKDKAKKKADKEKQKQLRQQRKQREQEAAQRQKEHEQQTAERKKQRDQQAAERKQQREQEAAQRQKEREQESIERQKEREQKAMERQKEREQKAAQRQKEREEKKGGQE